MKSFDEILKAKLADPVRNKQGNVLRNERGEIMTAQEAMVMSIVNNAMKGDIAAISIVRNITREARQDSKGDSRTEAVEQFAEGIKQRLHGENLYDGQDDDIRLLAETRYMVDVLSRQTMAPDFEPVVVEYSRDGAVKSKPNPIIEMRDTQEQKYKADLETLRQKAQARKKEKSSLNI